MKDTSKGEFKAECNRSACNNKDAVFFNHSTKKYYCESCADLINEANYFDAMRLYGHDLCTLVKDINSEKEDELNSTQEIFGNDNAICLTNTYKDLEEEFSQIYLTSGKTKRKDSDKLKDNGIISNFDIAREYENIQQKKSNLSSNIRKLVVEAYNKMKS